MIEVSIPSAAAAVGRPERLDALISQLAFPYGQVARAQIQELYEMELAAWAEHIRAQLESRAGRE